MNVEDLDFCRAEWEGLIDQWIIGRNAERDRAMLKRRLLDGVKYESLAEEFDLSVQRVQAIIYKKQSKIFSKIK